MIVISVLTSGCKNKNVVSSSQNSSEISVQVSSTDTQSGLGDQTTNNKNTVFTNALLMKAFPNIKASADNTAKFEFSNNITTFDNSRWFSKWDEKNVFKAELKHSQSSNPYTLRIGKGGQLYSIMTPIGEIMPPQNKQHAWVDDTMLLTTYQYDLEPTANMKNSAGAVIDGFLPFIHQAGIYPQVDLDYQKGKQFWSPVVGERWDSVNNQYSTITLGMISCGPSYNRGDVLMYQNTRDMGNGVIEITYMIYNYNTSYKEAKENYKMDFSPWGGVKTSALPNIILSKPDKSWVLTNYQFGDPNGKSLVDYKNTGGWAAATEDAQEDSSYTMSWVFGNKTGKDFTNLFSFGKTDQERDFTVQSECYRGAIPPGSSYFCRLYYVFGKLSEVVMISNELAEKTEFGFLNFEQKAATKIPLYLKEENGQTIISETGTTPSFYVYAEPVKDSKPLYLIRDTKTNKLSVTCDPYMLMPKHTIPNDPLKRTGVRPYDGSSEIIKLYGFAMPQKSCDSSLEYVMLNKILTDKSYFPEKGIYDAAIMVRKN